ncbi:MAG: heme A synthase [Chitinophagaceae bacterium]|nr:MAG: heme A synthase [Chitinophagaceae bacterium]
MEQAMLSKNKKQVGTWLLIGVAMIVIQVMIGGITRLTESGLSITEWKPITGTLPPLNDAAWQVEFDKYRNTDQFKYVHQHFSLSDFKFIFFWEWFHRVWARLLGVVFLVGFVYFLVKKKFNKEMITPMIILFILGALQGLVGWIMVKSGLVPEKFYVGHVELTTHLLAAIGLLAYTAWFAYGLLPGMQKKVQQGNLRPYLISLSFFLVLQLMYGGFMAGLKAAATAPTWPDINGSFLPGDMFEQLPMMQNFVNNPILIHFMHRGLGYGIFIFTIIYFVESRKIIGHRLFSSFSASLVALISLQVLLGILTVVNATNDTALIWLGVTHQFVAMLIVLCMVALLFLTKKAGLAAVK